MIVIINMLEILVSFVCLWYCVYGSKSNNFMAA